MFPFPLAELFTVHVSVQRFTGLHNRPVAGLPRAGLLLCILVYGSHIWDLYKCLSNKHNFLC